MALLATLRVEQNRATFSAASLPYQLAAAKIGTACPMGFARSMAPLLTHRVHARIQAFKIACRSAIRASGVILSVSALVLSRLTNIVIKNNSMTSPK